MGSEDLFHKRKAKGIKNLARKRSQRDAYDKVLIVCEGEKTEPLYFKDARNHHKLNTLNIQVEGIGKDPLTLVEHAKALYKAEERLGDPYDKVFCVFDKDQHTTYEQALMLVKNIGVKGEWLAVTSVPCFEYWLLLHFNYSAQPFYPVPNLSASQAAVKKLKEHLPSYEKGDTGLYSKLLDQVETAIGCAKTIAAEAQRNKTDNTSTKMHEVIEYIRKIKTSTKN